MPFARWENFEACKREQLDMGHNEESAKKICGAIQERAEKGALLKARGLELLSKASEEDVVLGGYCSWDIEDDDGETLKVEAQVKALRRFFAQPYEYQLISVNHGRGGVGEMKLAQPMLSYRSKAGVEYYSHVNEVGTYLICKIRGDDSVTAQHYRAKARAGELNGYSVNAIPLQRKGSIILDMEYTAVTLTEKGVFTPINPRTRDVQVLSKAEKLCKQCVDKWTVYYREKGFPDAEAKALAEKLVIRTQGKPKPRVYENRFEEIFERNWRKYMK